MRIPWLQAFQALNHSLSALEFLSYWPMEMLTTMVDKRVISHNKSLLTGSTIELWRGQLISKHRIGISRLQESPQSLRGKNSSVLCIQITRHFACSRVSCIPCGVYQALCSFICTTSLQCGTVMIMELVPFRYMCQAFSHPVPPPQIVSTYPSCCICLAPTSNPGIFLSTAFSWKFSFSLVEVWCPIFKFLWHPVITLTGFKLPVY